MQKSCILFDLGGVLYDINHSLTRTALQSLQKTESKPLVFALETIDPVFGLYDAGLINSHEFRNHLRADHGVNASDEEINAAWNAMLIGLYHDAIDTVKQLREHYTIALLSNINEIHFDAIQEECSELFSLFHHTVFSYHHGKRKPDPTLFSKTIQKIGCSPAEIVFLDDTPANCLAAQTLGITSILINPAQAEWRKQFLVDYL